MSAPQRQTEKDSDQMLDEVFEAVAWHDGDKDATIRTLLDDCKHLREQLALACATMSVGFARGWRPSVDRSVEN
ncbi:hypothetical protein N182_35980 [Sinorhizobium sp. GL2]|nr:hypothetical protein N182_35980 [Sinorhizobium sp. GL2]